MGARWIGPGHPSFIIAEAGVNHNGDIGLAKKLVRVAAEAGADAVKFQTFKAESLVTVDAPKAEYQNRNTGSSESQFEMLQKLELGYEQFRELADFCRECGILFLSTAFDEESADFLNGLEMPAFKIPSGELTNLPLIRHVSAYGKPVLISTGMANLEEVGKGLEAARAAGCKEILLFHCLSNYPANPAEVNLRAMGTMEKAFDVPVGYSDHTLGVDISLAAVAAGACMIEKHFTLDPELPGPDHKASLDPSELAEMVQGIRALEKVLGHGRKEPAESEKAVAAVARRSLVAACRIGKGEIITAGMLLIRRPGTGLPPSEYDQVLGRRAAREIPEGTVMQEELLS
ncbi:MAG: N-acetylneuraminate synthase [Blastochloris sp.]|nr:N-acetylneuraminate synthase [Blastochloris sp.]